MHSCMHLTLVRREACQVDRTICPIRLRQTHLRVSGIIDSNLTTLLHVLLCASDGCQNKQLKLEKVVDKTNFMIYG